jgi:LuxR family maltose regulon positive regulatory protein
MGVCSSMSEESATDNLTTTPYGDPIMTIKLEPSALPPWLVVRERLRDRLAAVPAGRFTLVTGPAGAGKTTMVADWVTNGRPAGHVAWLALEPEDDQPAAFWSYVVASLDRCGAGLGLHRRHAVTDTVDRAFLIRLAVSLAEAPEPVVLVLDDVHHLSCRAILDGLHFLIEHAGPHLRLVMIGRTDPALPLHRYRVAGSITEICHRDLAFTRDEANELLAAHGARLDSTAVATLTELTSGWAAALRLEARALPGAGQEALPAALTDYVRNEVLADQPSATRDLLSRTCVSAVLPGGLAVELTGRRDAVQILDRLADEGIFVTTPPGAERTYVCQPLVRQILLDELAGEPADRLASLHAAAARWYVRAGRDAEAVPHAAAAGDWELATAAVVRSLTVADLLTGPRAGDFAAMPADLDTAEAAVIHAVRMLAAGDLDLCAKHLLRAGELPATLPDGDELTLRLSLAVVDVARARRSGEPDDRAATSELAERIMAEAETVPAELAAFVRTARGASLLWAGDAAGARQVLRTAAAPDESLSTEASGLLALAEALCGRLRRATELARETVEHAHDPAAASVAEVALAWAHAEEYNLAAARIHADRAAILLAVAPDPLAAGVLALVRTRVHRARGDLGRAVEVLGEVLDNPAGPLPAWLAEVLSLVRAGLLNPGEPPEGAGSTAHRVLAEAAAALGAGDPAAARRTAEALTQRADLPLDLQVDSWLIMANVELADDHRDQARRALRRALAVAETERLRRPLLEAPAPVRRLLREDHELSARHTWLGLTTELPRTAAGTAPIVLVEPLTAKETEVLGYLAQLLSTEEIARTMYVSVNTVKTHVRGVLRKLAATRRNEAVRRARELGLL